MDELDNVHHEEGEGNSGSFLPISFIGVDRSRSGEVYVTHYCSSLQELTF